VTILDSENVGEGLRFQREGGGKKGKKYRGGGKESDIKVVTDLDGERKGGGSKGKTT